MPPAPSHGPFGAWSRDADVLRRVRDALEHGRPVAIRGAFKDAVAQAMHRELRAAVAASAQDSTLFVESPPSQLKPIPDESFRRTPRKRLCKEMRRWGRQGFQFRGHGLGPKLRQDASAIPKSIEVLRGITSPSLLRWVGELIGYPIDMAEEFRVADFHANLFWFQPGDFYGMHNDDTHEDGRLKRMLAFSYYLGPPESEGGWNDAWGGHLVWCRKATNSSPAKLAPPAFVAPDFNTMVIFRVDSGTEHFVERVFQTRAESLRAPRLSMVGWWMMQTPSREGAYESMRDKLHQRTSIQPPLVIE